jgi:hypothetical protein
LFEATVAFWVHVAASANEGQENGEEDEGVRGGPENEGDPDAEIVDFEDLWGKLVGGTGTEVEAGESRLHTLLLVKAKTPTPKILVIVIPLITLLATLTMAVQARASRPRKRCLGAFSIVARLGKVNARAIWAVNSTLIPTQMMRLTSETALRDTPSTAMEPMMAETVIPTTRVTTRPVAREPSMIVVMTRTAARAEPIRAPARRTMVVYWSKKM